MILKVGLFKEGIVERLETAYDPHRLDLEFIDLHYLSNVRLEGLAERIKQTVTFRGTLTSRIEQICARCLEPIERDLLAPFDLSYDVHGQETIDVTDDLRDFLLLERPDRFLCDMSCRGICPNCGVKLNRETCLCKTRVEHGQS